MDKTGNWTLLWEFDWPEVITAVPNGLPQTLCGGLKFPQ